MKDEAKADGSNPSRESEEVPVDLTKRRDEIIVGVEIPGFRKQDIDVSASEHSITIEAKRGPDAITRTIDLPEPIVPTRVDASYEDGTLWVTLRKQK